MIETAGGEERVARDRLHEHLTMIAKALGKLKLEIEAGLFTDSEIIVMLGENGTEKTTFIRMPAELMRPNDASVEIPELNVSCEPQTISPSFDWSVRGLLLTKIRSAWRHLQFATNVAKAMMTDRLLDQKVKNSSGGEL